MRQKEPDTTDWGIVETFEKVLDEYLVDEIAVLAQHYPKEQTTLEVPYHLIESADFDLADDLRREPKTIIQHFNQALRSYDLPIDLELSEATVRVTDLPTTETVGDFDPDSVTGDLVAIRGQVAKRSPREIVVHEAAYECERCGTFQYTRQPDAEHRRAPNECQGCERNGPFDFRLDESTTKQYQEIRLQTPPEEATGQDTDTIDVRLEGELVGTVNPGDRIIANVWANATWKNESSAILDLFGMAHSIERLESSFEEIDTAEFEDEIAELKACDDITERIIDSIAPTHMGDAIIKEAIAYQLFGGVNGTHLDGSLKRGTIHVLLCGDPGCGKSKLLSNIKRIAPRAVKTTGKGTTNAGLTFAAVQDDFGQGGRSIEAGALVQAHKGVCCIDELDKMDVEDQDGVLECMSDQEVSRAVWGMVRNLPAETSILAAENPVEGRFTQYGESVAEQIGLSSALMSRFDLIYTLTDRQDTEHDQALADHITKSAQETQQREAGQNVEHSHSEPAIEPEVLRAYIAEARELTPVLTDEAREKINSDYVDLREESDPDGPISVTARDPLAVIRLAEAAARMDHSVQITTEHVDRVIGVRRAYLADVGMDPETGEFDVDMIETGQSKAQRDRVRSIKDIIRDLQNGGGVDLTDVLETAEDEGIQRQKAEHQIQKMRDQGELYAPDNGVVHLV